MVQSYVVTGKWLQSESRKKFFTQRVVRHWNGLCGEVQNASSLEMFKALLEGAVCKLVQWEVSARGRGLGTR